MPNTAKVEEMGSLWVSTASAIAIAKQEVEREQKKKRTILMNQTFNNEENLQYNNQATIVEKMEEINLILKKAGLKKGSVLFFIADRKERVASKFAGMIRTELGRKLDLIDTETESSVLKTFTDYSGETTTDLLEVRIAQESRLINKMIMDADIPEEILIVMIKRDNKVLVPKGSTLIKEGDILFVSGSNIESMNIN